MNNNEFEFYKLKKWIKIHRLDWWILVTNKDAIPFIEKT